MARWRESLEQREREEIEARRQAPVKTAERESARREGAVIPPHEYIDVVQVETADAPVWVAYLEQQGIPVRTYETGNGTVSVRVPRNQLDRARHLSGGARFQRAPRSD